VEAAQSERRLFQKENQRIYPKRDLASHVLGFVDLDEKGLGGIEYELDGQIRGKSEKIIVMADARQRWFDGGRSATRRGANVVLTLDEKIQYIAERELAAAIARTHAMAGTVMVRIRTAAKSSRWRTGRNLIPTRRTRRPRKRG